MRRVRLTVAAALAAWTFGAATAGAQNAAPAAWALDLQGTFLAEAWDYNLSKENLAGGSLAVRHRVTEHWSIGAEACGFAAKQRGFKHDAVLLGGGPVVRGRFPVTARTGLVAEIMLGLSHADRRVPPRGTRFNYLARASGGVSYPLTRSVTGSLLVTFLHVSNNGHEGRDRNPDIQSLGGMLGITVPF